MNTSEKTSAGNGCPTKLLSDTPAATDMFGSHERVASAIANMVLTEQGGHAIALEGTWGSGKSTVVKLLAKELDGQVFEFDAWSHEDDPLRRVFIERLIDFLWKQIPACRQEHWQTMLAELRAREKTVTTTSVPSLTWTALIVATLVLLAPVSLVFLGRLAGELGKATPSIYWYDWLIAALYPLLVIVPVYSAVRQHLIKRKKKPSGRDEGGALSLLVLRKAGTTTTTTNETPQPSTLEFESHFAELLTDALHKGNDRLVIVVDNIDRLPPEQARSVWATLRVFVERLTAKDDGAAWCKCTWLLVPYDRASLEDLWRDRGESNNESSHAPTSFIEKTFQIRFDVPALVLSDWRGFVLDLLGEAFPSHQEPDELQRVYRLSALLAEKKGRSPTPRHLKLYVNDIGGLHRQHGDRFPLHHLAYYAILRREGRQIRRELVEGQIPDEPFATVLGENVSDDIAALFFNTRDIEKAQDLLLRQPILEALTTGDEEGLKTLAGRSGFWPLAESLLMDSPSEWKDRPTAACKAAEVVFACKLREAPDRPEASRTVALFGRRLVSDVDWKQLDSKSACGIAAAIQLANSLDSTRQMLHAVSKLEISEGTGAAATEWAKGLHSILIAARSLGHSETIDEGVAVPGDAQTLLHVCAALSGLAESKQFWPALRSKAKPDEIAKALTPSVSKWDTAAQTALFVIASSKMSVSWEVFVESCQGVVRGADVRPQQLITEILDALQYIHSKTSTAHAARKRWVSEGYIHHHLNGSQQAGDSTATGRLLYEILLLYPTLTTAPPSVGTSAAGHQLVTAVLADPSKHEDVVRALADVLPVRSPVVANIVKQIPHTAKLLLPLTKRLLETGRCGTVVNADLMLASWPQLSQAVGADVFSDIVEAMIKDGGLSDAAVKGGWDQANAPLYVEMISHGALKSGGFNNLIGEGLRTTSAEAWADALVSDDGAIRLLLKYVDAQPRFSVGSGVADGLRVFGNRMLAGEVSDTWTPEWDAVKSVCSESTRRELGKNLLDDAVNRSGGSTGRLFDLFGEELQSAVGENKRLVRRVFSPILERRDVRGAKWVMSVIESRKLQAFRDVPDEDRQAFNERVGDACRAELESEFGDIARSIATAVGIEIPRSAEEEAEEGGNET